MALKAALQAPFAFLTSHRAKVLFAGPVGLAILAAFIGCAMDLDHFIYARSLRIQVWQRQRERDICRERAVRQRELFEIPAGVCVCVYVCGFN